MATSADPRANIDHAAAVCAKLAQSLIALAPVSPAAGDAPAVAAAASSGPPYRRKLPAPLLNVNVPPGEQWPVAATRLGLRLYEDLVEFRIDPRGREYLWIGGGGVRHEQLSSSDTDAYDRGMVSVTALRLDLTAVEGAAVLAEQVVKAVLR
jgi:5'-nucleotidase